MVGVSLKLRYRGILFNSRQSVFLNCRFSLSLAPQVASAVGSVHFCGGDRSSCLSAFALRKFCPVELSLSVCIPADSVLSNNALRIVHHNKREFPALSSSLFQIVAALGKLYQIVLSN